MKPHLEIRATRFDGRASRFARELRWPAGFTGDRAARRSESPTPRPEERLFAPMLQHWGERHLTCPSCQASRYVRSEEVDEDGVHFCEACSERVPQTGIDQLYCDLGGGD